MLTNTTECYRISSDQCKVCAKLYSEGHSQGKFDICESGIKECRIYRYVFTNHYSGNDCETLSSAGSGSIEFPEFLKLMQEKMASSDPEEDMKEAFKVEYIALSVEMYCNFPKRYNRQLLERQRDSTNVNALL